MSAGGERKLMNWSDVIEGPTACFCRSTDRPGIQLADFASFIITRSQWIAARRNPGSAFGKADELILRAAARLNILNLPMRLTTQGELGRGSFEEWLAVDRAAKGLPSRPPSGK